MNLIRKVPEFIMNRKLGFSEPVAKGNNGQYGEEDTKVTEADNYDHANLISSQVMGAMHMPVLDIDFDAHLEPSSTPGHFHLYLNKPMGWHQYVTLLGAMEYAGVLEPGFVDLSVQRGASYVRKPGIKKTKKRL